ncbi:DUF3889 domain-containing protein [Paenibacillus sacheonensis]|uniref:DUF3889 domain-containing protein n=1 Tax=Paenibacillus sacheonensis TaxID=742054 RepID=A0A7X4YRT6_9BACL|nr:DUF3889 domain-containing protein [Paenibacillus sacheonensis]MBM7567592.1 hypothetical protein [Paenibacillus sacheonensis]NBC71305.1 DUF3889 domain-containing protein [Paenibacillus sacheonensis]
MKRLFAILIVLLLLSVSVPVLTSAAPAKYDPADGYHQYIKWIGAARKAAQERYPKAALVDLLYVGCKAEWPAPKRFVYKFWMQENDREFGVYVTVDEAASPDRARASRIEKTDAILLSYGHWSRYANEAVQAEYPGAEIVGWRPFGCACLGKEASSQVFRFWFRQGGRSQVMRVTVSYNPATNKALGVKFEPIRSFSE